jgi:hypothetical protein
MADIRPDRLTTCQSERKSVVSRRPSVLRQKISLIKSRPAHVCGKRDLRRMWHGNTVCVPHNQFFSENRALVDIFVSIFIQDSGGGVCRCDFSDILCACVCVCVWPLKVNQRFGGTYRLHLQDRRISRARYQILSTDYTTLYPRRQYFS